MEPLEYVAERTRNVFVNSPTGARLLSAAMLPWFSAMPPDGWGVLATRGRRTGKTRRKCVRAICQGGAVYLVSLHRGTAWLRNVRADPRVRLRLKGATVRGVAREPSSQAERAAAREVYRQLRPFDYIAYMQHGKGRPTAGKVRRLLETWFTRGVPVIVELDS